ncbi:hypothetical protein KO481_05360 [Nocardia sp. NEAU-G5]|uniref:Uncharacterized protein n=1 Tax=Nocardia albiluteola TaxID=2842303 RepID=A0ABS6ASE2_9NOCA|nr:hypothetical protein [Nocardia albiluteola]MBU3060951.1 hypothetical protein [Nocardia albiluteola]
MSYFPMGGPGYSMPPGQPAPLEQVPQFPPLGPNYQMPPQRRGHGALIAVVAAAVVAALAVAAGVAYAMWPSSNDLRSIAGDWTDKEKVVVRAFPKIVTDPGNQAGWQGTRCYGDVDSPNDQIQGVTCSPPSVSFTVSILDTGNANAAVAYLAGRTDAQWQKAAVAHDGFSAPLSVWTAPSGDEIRTGFGADSKFGRYVVDFRMDGHPKEQLIAAWKKLPLR